LSVVDQNAIALSPRISEASVSDSLVLGARMLTLVHAVVPSIWQGTHGNG